MGERGEALAARWYAERGYALLEQNWRCAEGEIDLVLRIGTTLVVCEVKTRRTNACGTPLDSVTPAKRLRLRKLAARWLRERAVRCEEVRFDVAGVIGDQVTVVPGAW